MEDDDARSCILVILFVILFFIISALAFDIAKAIIQVLDEYKWHLIIGGIFAVLIYLLQKK